MWGQSGTGALLGGAAAARVATPVACWGAGAVAAAAGALAGADAGAVAGAAAFARPAPKLTVFSTP